MKTLLFIKASPRNVQSDSVTVAQAYLESLTSKMSGIRVDTIDLWEEDLPAFDGDKVGAKLAVLTGQSQTATQKTAWDRITGIAQRFISADHYLFAIPMWNLGVPYRLKQYIDVIHQPGLTFGLDPKTGYFGLLKDKKATVVYTAGAFSPSFPAEFGTDHQSTYVRAWLNQAGVTDIKEIRYQPTLLTADRAGDLEGAKETARTLGAADASAAMAV